MGSNALSDKQDLRLPILDADWYRGDVEQVLNTAAYLLFGLQLKDVRNEWENISGAPGPEEVPYEQRNMCSFLQKTQDDIKSKGCFTEKDFDNWKEICSYIMKSLYEDVKKATRAAPQYDDFRKKIKDVMGIKDDEDLKRIHSEWISKIKENNNRMYFEETVIPKKKTTLSSVANIFQHLFVRHVNDNSDRK
jgi:hypothetical protein